MIWTEKIVSWSQASVEKHQILSKNHGNEEKWGEYRTNRMQRATITSVQMRLYTRLWNWIHLECAMGENFQDDGVLRSSHAKRAENVSEIAGIETKNENREVEHQNRQINPANTTRSNKWIESFHFEKRNSNEVPLGRKWWSRHAKTRWENIHLGKAVYTPNTKRLLLFRFEIEISVERLWSRTDLSLNTFEHGEFVSDPESVILQVDISGIA